MTRILGATAGLFVLSWVCTGATRAGEQAEKLPIERSFEQAAKSAEIAGYSLSKVHRWLHERALKQIDPATKLYRADGQWNYRNTAADCYPFLVWAAYAVDREALDGPVREVLHAEIKLCNHIDRIPVPYDFAKKGKVEDPLETRAGRYALRKDPLDEHRGQRRADPGAGSTVRDDTRKEIPYLG